MKRRIALGLLSLALLACGGYLAADEWLAIGEARASVGWPTAKGTVVAVGTARAAVSEGKEPGKRGGFFSSPLVYYRYTVNGKGYASPRLRIGRGALGAAPSLAELHARFPAGAQVSVHYDPAAPHIAVLDAGAGTGDYAVLALGLALIGCGLFWAVVALGRTRLFPVMKAQG
jgi:hypothetical protein